MNVAAPEAWKLSVRCARADIETVEAGFTALAPADAPPTLVSSEIDARATAGWVVEAYFTTEPSADIHKHWPGATLTPVYPEDWVTASQRDMHPINAGRFYVHTSTNVETLPLARIGLSVDAGQAFGTGQHATTYGCLLAIDQLARTYKPRRVLDVGTGTGILAIACVKAWRAQATATDIDPVAIEFAHRTVRQNHVLSGSGAGSVRLAVANGLTHPIIRQGGPYDLIIANILADPLIGLAPSIRAALAPGGFIILSGLLVAQAPRVAHAYTARGLTLLQQKNLGDWAALTLRARRH